jgi:hypothetical protein
MHYVSRESIYPFDPYRLVTEEGMLLTFGEQAIVVCFLFVVTYLGETTLVILCALRWLS